MRKMLIILRYEYKMQLRRVATWGVLLATIVVAQLDCFPSPSNLARLEFLPQPAYFIHRIMSLYGIILVFGLLFLLSNRFRIDNKTGVKPLFMAAPMQRWHYIGGKLLAGFAYTFTVVVVFLVFNTALYIPFSPVKREMAAYTMPLIKTILISGLPVSLFVGFCAVALPAVLDIRLFYFASAGVFAVNASAVGSAGQMPFYLITSGDLMKLLWQHPKFPFTDMGSVAANLAFLIGCALVSWGLPFCKRRFWRAD